MYIIYRKYRIKPDSAPCMQIPLPTEDCRLVVFGAGTGTGTGTYRKEFIEPIQDEE